MQHAHAFEVVQDGRIYIEVLNGPFLFGDKGTPGGVFGWPQGRHRTRLAHDARKWHLRAVSAKQVRTCSLKGGIIA